MADLLSVSKDRLLRRRAAVARKQASDREPESDREALELREIDAALTRIAARSYGHCERCGGPIGRQRLAAVPEARLCMGCAR
jgi:DnaK suppressor protein